MAPGSWGARAVFVCFSGEDFGQTGDATGEPRVARHSWIHHLSNAPGLTGQLAVSWKDFAREAAVQKKNGSNLRPIFPRFLSVFVHVFDLASKSVFDVLGTVGKLALPSFSRFWARGKPSLG